MINSHLISSRAIRYSSYFLPYGLLALFLLFAAVTTQLSEPLTSVAWTSGRWLLRLVFLGGVWWGWRQHRDQRPPEWWFVWLGFGIYELVGLFLSGVIWLLDQGALAGGGLIVLALPVLAFAFLPYLFAAIWSARQDRQLALITVFPHAALTVPLFMLVIDHFGGGPLDPSQWVGSFAACIVAGAIITLLPALTYRQRWLALYGGMLLTQLLFVGIAVLYEGVYVLFLIIPLSMLGLTILTGPLILLPLLDGLIRFSKRMGAAPLLERLKRLHRDLRAQFRLDSQTSISPVRPNGPRHKVISIRIGGSIMSEETRPEMIAPIAATRQNVPDLPPQPPISPSLERLYKLAVIILSAIAICTVVLLVGRATVYKIHEYERGLHLRGGRFLNVQTPGWHFQIPLMDTVIIVKVNERLGYVERIPAMTSDNVTMIVSLQYTYRVTDPQQYALQVDDPERIVFEFVQGKLRDVVNTKAMADVMNNRALMNQEVMEILKEKEMQYGVQFVTVQMQSASPPDEVLSAIKDRMVAAQRQEQAQAEAAQQKTIADAEFYTAKKRADATAYEITTTAQAESDEIRLTTEARQLAVRAILSELEGKGELGTKFIEYLMTQELKSNSKWIINGQGAPILDLRGDNTTNGSVP